MSLEEAQRRALNDSSYLSNVRSAVATRKDHEHKHEKISKVISIDYEEQAITEALEAEGISDPEQLAAYEQELQQDQQLLSRMLWTSEPVDTEVLSENGSNRLHKKEGD